MIKKRVIAVCGKGGVGKTAFVAMMTRMMQGREDVGRLLVIDADPALGLPRTLGISVEHTMGDVRNAILAAAESPEEEQEEIANMLDYMVMESLVETNGYAFLAMGRTDAKGCFCSINDILKAAIHSLSDSFDTILIDGEAGLEQINRQVMDRLDTLVILSDASHRGRQTISYINNMVEKEHVISCRKTGVVFNRVRMPEEQLRRETEGMGLEVFGIIPPDEAVETKDFEGGSLWELSEDTLAMTAIKDICDRILRD